MDYDHIFTRTEAEFTDESVKLLSERIRQSIDDYGHAIVGLSGGSTPRTIFGALGREAIDWKQVTVFLTDERYVPADHQDSNQRMIRESLLAGAGIPADQVVFPDTELPLPECIGDYEQRLADMLSRGIPHMVVLGMGNDGHIASLFPPLAETAFGDRLVMHTTTDHFAVHDRISVTMIILGSAERKIFLLKGKDKETAWNEMLQNPEDIERWPAAAVLNLGGGTVVSCF